MLKNLPTSIQEYIMCFLHLHEYNHLYLFVKLRPNYKLYFKHCPDELPKLIDDVCKNKQLININLVKFLHYEVKAKCTRNAMSWASYHGHLYVVKFLHLEVNAPYTAVAMNSASSHGHLDVVKFLHFVVKAPYSENL